MSSPVILITGASSGLGAGMARLFAARGARLALCARRLEELKALRRELLGEHPEVDVHILPLDVNDHAAVFHAFRAFHRHFGRLDRVIINAGIGKGQPLGTGGFEANRQTAETNFVAALAQAEAAMELFRAQQQGHLVFLSSVSACRGMRGTATTYAATKAGVAHLAEGLRSELWGSRIRITTLFPGYILTPINAGMAKAPFRVDVDTGCRALVRAIEREVPTAALPRWPWGPISILLRVLPLRWARHLT